MDFGKRSVLLPVLFVTAVVITSGCTSLTGEAISDPQDAGGFVWDLFFREPPNPPGKTIRIATWNIENFGKTKASDPDRMAVIAEVLSRYDLIAVQEISNLREESDPGCPRNEDDCPQDPNCDLIKKALEENLNKDLGLNYSFSFSPQVRDERYLFIYNPEKVKLLDSFIIEDSQDSGPLCSLSEDNRGRMNRQPYVGIFLADDFDFALITAHTSPRSNLDELDGLEYFIRKSKEFGEPDIILAGDINADCSYLGEDDGIDLKDPEYHWIVPDSSDTTVGKSDCAYDRIIIMDPTEKDYSGRWGIDRDIPDDVSDHYLVWADFFTERDSD